jgi:hypothetical protein
MSGVVFFGKQMWSCMGAGHDYLLDLAIDISGDDASAIAAFESAKEVSCLNIDQHEDKDLRRRLATYVRTAALEWIEDEIAEGVDNGIANLRRLVAFTDEYLNNLPNG